MNTEVYEKRVERGVSDKSRHIACSLKLIKTTFKRTAKFWHKISNCLINNWANKRNRQLSKDIKMANKYLKSVRLPSWEKVN